ncbi:unnamed protein product [Arctia plantaginis]|uniref:Ommochrome-binding protein-like n=1 Tax=Arctia plantaginis TaxID=874455 RepID=A0A8S1A9X1_ARCPL|nr:unnamed protein product [Arctia plantaginis]
MAVKCIQTHFAVLLLLSSKLRGQDYGTVKPHCDIVEFNSKYFDRQILFGGYGRSFNLFFHELSGSLFFSRATQKTNLTDRQIIMCNRVKDYCTYVHGLDKGSAIAYDQNSDEIFFGTPDGVYRYDYFLKKAKRVGVEDVPIGELQIFDKFFYYTVQPVHKLYMVENYNFSDVALVMYTEVDHFHVSRRKVFYVSNRTALYEFSNTKSCVLTNRTNLKIRQIVEDSEKNVYFGTNEGVYTYKNRFRRIMKMPIKSELFGLTVVNLLTPKNNLMIIYSDAKNIYRLIASDNTYCINDYIARKKKYYEKNKRKNDTVSLKLQLIL